MKNKVILHKIYFVLIIFFGLTRRITVIRLARLQCQLRRWLAFLNRELPSSDWLLYHITLHGHGQTYS